MVGLGQAWKWIVTANRHEVSFGGDGHVRKFGGDAYMTLNILKTTQWGLQMTEFYGMQARSQKKKTV